MRRLLAVALVLPLAGCGLFSPNTDLTNLKASQVGCVTGAGWNGAPMSVLVMNQENIVGTKGGVATVKCGGTEITFTDSGNLNLNGQLGSIRVPIETPPAMRLVPSR